MGAVKGSHLNKELFYIRYLSTMFDRRKEYKNKDLLNKNELAFFYELKKYLNKNFWEKYYILSQVRVLDFFQKSHSLKTFKWSLDFLICDFDNAMKPVLAIELNWYSHLGFWQRLKDKSKRQLLEKREIPLEIFMVDTFFHEERIDCKIRPYLSVS